MWGCVSVCVRERVSEWVWKRVCVQMCMMGWMMVVIIETVKLKRTYGWAEKTESFCLPPILLTHTRSIHADPLNICVKGERLHLLMISRQTTQARRGNWHTHRLRSRRAARRCDRLNQASRVIPNGFGKRRLTLNVRAPRLWAYLYIFPWYRSHQNILLVDTSTSSATAFFSVGTTCVYSLFSRSMRRISWRLVNIRYGLFPDGESKDSNVTTQDCSCGKGKRLDGREPFM